MIPELSRQTPPLAPRARGLERARAATHSPDAVCTLKPEAHSAALRDSLSALERSDEEEERVRARERNEDEDEEGNRKRALCGTTTAGRGGEGLRDETRCDRVDGETERGRGSARRVCCGLRRGWSEGKNDRPGSRERGMRLRRRKRRRGRRGETVGRERKAGGMRKGRRERARARPAHSNVHLLFLPALPPPPPNPPFRLERRLDEFEPDEANASALIIWRTTSSKMAETCGREERGRG